MTRVLVVSPQTLVAMALQDEYDVTAIHPSELEPALVERGYDVTVLDGADVDATVRLLTELPRQLTGPILLLAHDEQSATVLDSAKGLSDIRIGPPISGAGLRDTLHGIAHGQPFDPGPSRGHDEPAAPPVEEPPATRSALVAGFRRDQGELERRLHGRRTPPLTFERAGTPADLLSLAQGLPVYATPGAQADRRTGAARRSPGQQVPTAGLVRELLERVPGLLGVDQVAAAIADDACQRVGASASAVLVREEGRWVVAAGVGLRPRERLLQLDDEHWLVREVVRARHGLIVEDTDVARRDLVGAPLSASRHLLIVPITGVAGLLMAARGAPGVAFTSPDLTALARLAAEADSPLREAMQLRELGRRLSALDASVEELTAG